MGAEAKPSTARPKTTLAPVRLRFWDDNVRANVTRLIGWRVSCGCGYRSRIHRNRPSAVAEARWHRIGHE